MTRSSKHATSIVARLPEADQDQVPTQIREAVEDVADSTR